MHPYCKAFTDLLADRNYRYNGDPDQGLICVPFSGKSKRVYEIFVGFPDNDNGKIISVMGCVSDTPFDGQKFAKAVVLCNTLNSKRMFVRWYMIDDKKACCQYDFVLSHIEEIDDIIGVISLMGDGLDEVYPDFMKIMWA